jgi:hypothetical protein
MDLLALEEGLDIENQNDYTKFIVEGDSLFIIDMIKEIQQGSTLSKIIFSWCLEALLVRVANLMRSIPIIIPSNVKWTTKKLADWIANEGMKIKSDRWEEIWDPTNTTIWKPHVTL